MSASREIVVTGVGLVTPLGEAPREVLDRVLAHSSAAAAPTGFPPATFACPVAAEVRGFDPQPYVAEAKLLRLMNRDARFAVVAARRALDDAALVVGRDYAADEIALFGATGPASLPLDDVAPLVRAASTSDGHFEASRLGDRGLKAISPVLSFKILANMPVCFVSICLGIEGPNGIYTPDESQGAQAIAEAVRLLRRGLVPCALAGGCDVRTGELAFLDLEQRGRFESWRASQAGPTSCRPAPDAAPGASVSTRRATAPIRPPAGWPAFNAIPAAWEASGLAGVVPGEGAAFIVLEERSAAAARGARALARLSTIVEWSLADNAGSVATVGRQELRALLARAQDAVTSFVSAAEPGAATLREEAALLESLGSRVELAIAPKASTGNLFAAAAALQVALGAQLARAHPASRQVLVNCRGERSTAFTFLLEQP